MTLPSRARRALLVMLCAAAVPAVASQAVDAGRFAVYVDGRRIATESFRIEQDAGRSVSRSELFVGEGGRATQTAQLELGPDGSVRRYRWEQVQTRANVTVEPAGDFLVEHVQTDPGSKPQDVPHVLTPAVSVLDDNIFLHREILVWRYLAENCRVAAQGACALPKAQMSVLVPNQHASSSVTVEYVGPQRTLLRGVERELRCFRVQDNSGAWMLWFDDGQKLQKIVVESSHTEVVREP